MTIYMKQIWQLAMICTIVFKDKVVLFESISEYFKSEIINSAVFTSANAA
jgi:hypothetical protein